MRRLVNRPCTDNLVISDVTFVLDGFRAALCLSPSISVGSKRLGAWVSAVEHYTRPREARCGAGRRLNAKRRMKAAVRHEYGPPEKVLNIEEVDTPTPADDEVLVRVHAASVNLGSWEILTAAPLYIPVLMRIFGPKPRHAVVPSNDDGASVRRGGLFKPRYKILGADIAGRVEAVGRNVTQFQPGDEVFGD